MGVTGRVIGEAGRNPQAGASSIGNTVHALSLAATAQPAVRAVSSPLNSSSLCPAVCSAAAAAAAAAAATAAADAAAAAAAAAAASAAAASASESTPSATARHSTCTYNNT